MVDDVFDDSFKEKNKEDFSMNLTEEDLKKLSELVKSSLLDEMLNITSEELEEFENNNDNNNFENDVLKENDFEKSFNKNKKLIEENFYKHNSLKECIICGSKIKDFGHYTIEFGDNIRKKANFCGLDCLSEFIEELKYTKGLKQKNINKNND